MGGRRFEDIQTEQRLQPPVLDAEALDLVAQLIRTQGVALIHGSRPVDPGSPWLAGLAQFLDPLRIPGASPVQVANAAGGKPRLRVADGLAHSSVNRADRLEKQGYPGPITDEEPQIIGAWE